MNLSGDMPVTLVIKAPNQRMADQTVDCMLGWTIKKLKQHLEAVYPSKPKHNEQRLIYSGRLLQDHLTLKEILRQYDDSEFINKHTVHLVCSTVSDSASSSSSSTESTPSKTENATCQNSATQSQVNSYSSVTQESSAMASDSGDRLRYRGHGQQTGHLPPHSASTSASYNQPNVMGGDTITNYPAHVYSPEQYAWMVQQQQIYSQYMMQFMQYYQNLYYPSLSFNPPSPAPQFLQQPVVGTSIVQQQEQAPGAQPQPAVGGGNNAAGGAARQNVRVNAQGRVEEDDEEIEPRDWLRHTYFIMRFLTFMGILFFYSNMTRFLIVFIGSFAIYILQKIRKYMQRVQREQLQQQQQNQATEAEPQQQEQVDQQNQQPEENSQQEGTSAEENSNGSGLTEDQSAEEEQQPQQEEQPESNRMGRVVIFICNMVQTFFTSLLPAPPELLDPN